MGDIFSSLSFILIIYVDSLVNIDLMDKQVNEDMMNLDHVYFTFIILGIEAVLNLILILIVGVSY